MNRGYLFLNLTLLQFHAELPVDYFPRDQFFRQEIPKVRKSMLTALGNVVNTHLMDPNLFDFKSLSAGVGNISDELDAAVGVHNEQGEELAMPALVSLTR